MSLTNDVNGDDTALAELAASARSIAKRLESLAKMGRSRHANNKYIKCLADAAELAEAAGRVVTEPHLPVPTINSARPEPENKFRDPAQVARRMADSIARHAAGSGSIPDVSQGEVSPSVVLRGRCDTISINDILDLLTRLNKSGVLWIKSKEETFTVQIENGYVVHAFSDNTPREHLLGNILVEQGAISAEQLEEFLTTFTRWKGKIGTALERERLVTPDQVAKAIEHQVILLFERIAQEQRAEFTFSEGVNTGGDGVLRLSIEHLMFGAART